MVSQKRSYCSRYDSSSRHSLIIVGRNKGIVGMVLYSKACRKCNAAENNGEKSEEYECPKNFEGSPKSMESSSILKMLEDALYNCFFIIYFIFSNDDSTMHAVLKHPSIGVRVQVMNSSKRKLDEEITEPSFLAYTSHRMKVVAKHIFSIYKANRSQ